MRGVAPVAADEGHGAEDAAVVRRQVLEDLLEDFGGEVVYGGHSDAFMRDRECAIVRPARAFATRQE